MTHSEDIKRLSTNDTVDYLNARIKALENRVQYLEAVIEVNNLNNEEE